MSDYIFNLIFDTRRKEYIIILEIKLGSYVYDTETGLYYLQSRYYDPKVGRFINADAFASTGQGVLGNNMFAYCGNNPVNYSDPSGCRFGPTDNQIKAIYYLALGERGTALLQLQREARNGEFPIEFFAYQNYEPCCGGIIYGQILAGKISGPVITDEGITLAGCDISLIRCYIEWDYFIVSIGDMFNVNTSAGFSFSEATLGAMVSVWSPSVTVKTDRGLFTYTFHVGAIGGSVGADQEHGVHFDVAPGGFGFGFSYEPPKGGY